MSDLNLPLIVITAAHGLPDGANKAFGRYFRMVRYEEAVKWPEEERKAVVGVVNFGHFHIDGKFCKKFTSLKVVSNIGVGVDHIDVKDLKEKGIYVGHTPGVLSTTVAEMAFTLMLAAARNLIQADRYCHSDRDVPSSRPTNMFMGQDLYGKAVGIVGMGAIGKEIGVRCKAFGMKIFYHNRKPCTKQEETTAGRAFDKVVDTKALVNALKTKEIASAALDVTEPEPLPLSHELKELPNAILVPHIGSATRECRLRMTYMALDNLRLGLSSNSLIRTPGEIPTESEVEKINARYQERLGEDHKLT
ncbi:hypothetical protein AAMO2058_001382200 [Amorphochlora amoebiformis]